jgi:hypothetical protein
MAQPARGNDSSSRVRGEDFISRPLALCARRPGPQLALLPAAGPVSGGPENHGHVPCAHEDPEIGRCSMVDYDISDMTSLDALHRHGKMECAGHGEPQGLRAIHVATGPHSPSVVWFENRADQTGAGARAGTKIVETVGRGHEVGEVRSARRTGPFTIHCTRNAPPPILVRLPGRAAQARMPLHRCCRPALDISTLAVESLYIWFV